MNNAKLKLWLKFFIDILEINAQILYQTLFYKINLLGTEQAFLNICSVIPGDEDREFQSIITNLYYL